MKRIPIKTKTGNLYVVVDDDDYERLKDMRWTATKDGYALYVTRTYLHKLVVNAPSGQMVDHKDGNPLNCSKSNLRFCTPSQNTLNRRRNTQKNVQFKGVGVRTGRRTRYTASITAPGKKRKTIGYFPTARVAALAYDLWAHELHGEFARPNFSGARFGP